MRSVRSVIFLLLIRSAWPLTFSEVQDSETGTGENGINILFSQWITGQKEPCGCSMGMAGGLKTRKYFLNELRKSYKNLILVDAGNFLNPKLPIKTEKARKKQIEDSRAVLKAYKEWDFDAIALGNHDEKLDPNILKELLPDFRNFVLLSYKGFFTASTVPYILKEINGIKLQIIGVTDETIGEVTSSTFIKGYTPVFMGDAQSSKVEKLGNNIPKGIGEGFFLGSGEDLYLRENPKLGRLYQVFGATDKQEWMLLTLQPADKNYKFSSTKFPTFIREPQKAHHSSKKK